MQSFLRNRDVPPKLTTAGCRFREKSEKRFCFLTARDGGIVLGKMPQYWVFHPISPIPLSKPVFGLSK